MMNFLSKTKSPTRICAKNIRRQRKWLKFYLFDILKKEIQTGTWKGNERWDAGFQ